MGRAGAGSSAATRPARGEHCRARRIVTATGRGGQTIAEPSDVGERVTAGRAAIADAGVVTRRARCRSPGPLLDAVLTVEDRSDASSEFFGFLLDFVERVTDVAQVDLCVGAGLPARSDIPLS